MKETQGLDLRRRAAEMLAKVLEGAAFQPLGAEDMADARDRAFVNRLVTTALRRNGHINQIIGRLLERGMPKKSGRFGSVLRIALTELLFMERAADHSAVFVAVELVKSDKKSAHLAKLMNGVLRRAQREADELTALPAVELLPEWMASRWRKTYGAAALEGFADALLDGAPLDVTAKDGAKATLEQAGARHLGSDTHRITHRDRPVDALEGFADGQFWVQDAASSVPARLFDLAPGARVLDLCAAPGGKTAQLCKVGYAVTALDVSEERMQRVEANLARLGYEAQCIVSDGTTYTDDALFDGVLVDAPCTATGTFRRHPELLWHRRPQDIADRVALQRKLLRAAWASLKPGGVMIYASCSLEPEEGEEQAHWAMKALAGAQVSPISAKEADYLAPAIQPDGWLRLTPDFAPLRDCGRIDGFYTVRLRKS